MYQVHNNQDDLKLVILNDNIMHSHNRFFPTKLTLDEISLQNFPLLSAYLLKVAES